MGALAILALAGCGPIDAGGEKPSPTKPVKLRDQFASDRDPKPTDTGKPKVQAIPFDGSRAQKYVAALCDLGPRVSGSDGMAKQVALLTKHFEKYGGTVAKQEFQAQQKSQRDKVGMTNLVVSYFPDRPKRILFTCHYDTRPQADQEELRKNWNKPFVSANDGTSGVGFLMELAHHMKDFPTEVGVDFAMFDGEEYVFAGPDGNDLFFFGSKHFAAEYKDSIKTRKHTYSAAINLDLFAHEGAKIKVESFGLNGAKELVTEVWGIAEEVGAKSFKYERGYKRSAEGFVQDDHVPLLEVGIPAIDLIDFDYEHWHKLTDTADKIDAKQLEQVALVLTTWLQWQKK